MDDVWIAIGIGGIGALIATVLWWARGDSAGKAYGPDTAMGVGLSQMPQPPHIDSGSPGSSDGAGGNS